MKKGEEFLTDEDTILLNKMIQEVSAYEEETVVLPTPKIKCSCRFLFSILLW